MTNPQLDPVPPVSRRNSWQDAANVVLAIWLFISPWVLQFANAAAPNASAGGISSRMGDAAWNAWILGVIVFVVALSALGRMQFWQERVTLVLGIWIFIAPWVLGFVGLPRASWDHWIIGALIFLVSAFALSQRRGAPARVDMAHAGDKPRRDL